MVLVDEKVRKSQVEQQPMSPLQQCQVNRSIPSPILKGHHLKRCPFLLPSGDVCSIRGKEGIRVKSDNL